MNDLKTHFNIKSRKYYIGKYVIYVTDKKVINNNNIKTISR